MIDLPFYTLAALDPCQKGHDFFGLLPWYHYLKIDPTTCNIKTFTLLPGGGQTSDVPLVLLAVIDDLLRIAALVAIGYVLYGAFRYVASQGDPESTARAQSTIINALIGMAVAILAVALVSFLGGQLGG